MFYVYFLCSYLDSVHHFYLLRKPLCNDVLKRVIQIKFIIIVIIMIIIVIIILKLHIDVMFLAKEPSSVSRVCMTEFVLQYWSTSKFP